MKKASILAIVMAVSCPVAASAQHQGSMEDQIACTGDVYRLCSAFVPDEDKIVACLERNVPNLSPGCKKVFTRPDPGKKPSDDDDD